MKVLEIREIDLGSVYPALAEVSARLDELSQKNRIETINWSSHLYKPDVEFVMAYGQKEIYLKFYVREEYTKAEKYETNQMVCEDSCVELFISPSDDGIYYNLEFNPIGIALMGCGTGRHDSKRVDAAVVNNIRHLASMGDKPFSEISGDNIWTLTVAIPFETFFRHNIESVKGKSFRANLYKCGDKLTTPHYVTWNPVGSEKPDFHRPEYFGEIKFI